MDPNPVSALAMTSALADDLSPSDVPEAAEPTETVETVHDSFTAHRPFNVNLTEPERVVVSRLRNLTGASAFVIEHAATIAQADIGTVTSTLAKLGVPVQSPAGIVDGARLERALSGDGLTVAERSAAATAARVEPTSPWVRDYPGGPLHAPDGMALSDTEGLYSLARVIDNYGDPWGNG